jgi:hypothetical protein
MKTLQTYNRNGYTFTQLKRIGNVAAFEGKREGFMSTFEVIKIQSHNGREIHGTYCEPAEYPPCNAQWGVCGWSYQKESPALSRLTVEARKVTVAK